jgi:DNA-binding NtrC family response regulator
VERVLVSSPTGLPEQTVTEPGDTQEDRFSFTGAFPTIREVEEYLIAKAMRRSDGNQTIAADLLGITRQTLNKRLTRTRNTD